MKTKKVHINLSVTSAVSRDIKKMSKDSNKREFCRRAIDILIAMNKLRADGHELAMVKKDKIIMRLFDL